MRLVFCVLIFACGCSAPAEIERIGADAAGTDDEVAPRLSAPTQHEPDSYCVPTTVEFVDDAGDVHSVTFPCLPKKSTTRGASDPPGWGNDWYEHNEPPANFKLPPRTPPGDPPPF